MEFVTHNLIVCAARIVCPRLFLHDSPRHCLEVHQVEALVENRHMLDALLSLFFLWIFLLLLCFYSLHIHRSKVLALLQILIQCVRWMNRLVLFRGIFAGIFENDLRTAGVFWQELHLDLGRSSKD